jgi:hypothetical protein
MLAVLMKSEMMPARQGGRLMLAEKFPAEEVPSSSATILAKDDPSSACFPLLAGVAVV